MDTSEIIDSGFWRSSSCRVMVNQRDAGAVAEAIVIRDWVKRQKNLAGHVLFATSGSTGSRKWVAVSRDALLASARSVNDHLGVDSSDRWLLALPTFHVGGMGIVARCYEASCEFECYHGKWDPVSYREVCCERKITLSSMVPTQVVDIVRSGLSSPPSLRAVLIGGGRLDDVTYQQAMDLGWPIMETYGMTETCSQVATSILGGRALKLLSPWQVKTDASGRLMLRGEPLLTGYVSGEGDVVDFSDPRQGSWFLTGDIVHLSKGELTVMGRADRCVKVLGELVNLDEVTLNLTEGKLSALSVGEVVVLAVENVRKGVRLIVCTEGESLDEGRLHAYNSQCHPLHRIDESIVVDEMPRSALGKVQYSKLLTQVESQIQGS